MQDGAEYDRRGNRKKYQKPGYNLDRRSYEVDDGSDRLEQQVRFVPRFSFYLVFHIYDLLFYFLLSHIALQDHKNV